MRQNDIDDASHCFAMRRDVQSRSLPGLLLYDCVFLFYAHTRILPIYNSASTVVVWYNELIIPRVHPSVTKPNERHCRLLDQLSDRRRQWNKCRLNHCLKRVSVRLTLQTAA